jgi:hypothetical protein
MADLSCYDTAYPPGVRTREDSLVKARRDRLGDALPDHRVGLAFSGGGIRSATFCLGVVQALAAHRLLRRFDYLSTVSGGGYLGSFLGALICRTGLRKEDVVVGLGPEEVKKRLADAQGRSEVLEVVRERVRMKVRVPLGDTPAEKAERLARLSFVPGPKPEDIDLDQETAVARVTAAGGAAIDDVEAVLADPHSTVIDWLRENGRYLSPNGGGDELLAAATYLRNLVAVQVVLASLGLLILSVLAVVRAMAGRWIDLEGSQFSHLTWRLWWSPYLVLAGAVFVVLAVPLGWAYWSCPRDQRPPGTAGFFSQTLPFLSILATAGTMVAIGLGTVMRVPLAVQLLAGLIGGVTIVLLVGLRAVALLRPTRSYWKIARNRLTIALRNALVLSAVIAAIAFVDSLGQTLYIWVIAHDGVGPGRSLASVTGVVALAAAAKKLVGLLPKKGDARPRLPVALLAGLCAAVLLLAGLAVLSAGVHAVAWLGHPPLGDPWHQLAGGWPRGDTATGMSRRALAWLLGIAAILFGMIAPDVKFINLSSELSLYAGRLVRSYLGASNPRRAEGANKRITETIEGDDLPYAAYSPDGGGGPLHLVNVTVNQTVDGESQIEQRDRKGLPMVVGPHGLSAGVRSHALWEEGREKIRAVHTEGQPEFHLLARDASTEALAVERLTIGEWVAVSGAAFSTGLGARTSIGLSALLALLNVRLGYWWDSQIHPGDRAQRATPAPAERLAAAISHVFPVQSHLVQEMLARFHGPGRQRWYLTDGGHFENTAVYELIRRRLPFIVACDCGEDAGYDFEDLAALVRKARTDFSADIRFLGSKEIDDLVGDTPLRRLVGTLDELRPRKDEDHPVPVSAAHATLARVEYHEHPSAAAFPRRSVILFIKPTLVGGERRDIIQYKSAHGSFPQESTVDQYFDEAQWESYRALGHHVAAALFATMEGRRLVGLADGV